MTDKPRAPTRTRSSQQTVRSNITADGLLCCLIRDNRPGRWLNATRYVPAPAGKTKAQRPGHHLALPRMQNLCSLDWNRFGRGCTSAYLAHRGLALFRGGKVKPRFRQREFTLFAARSAVVPVPVTALSASRR